MNNLYNITAKTVDEWQALERLKAEAREEGFAEGYKQGLLRGQHDNVAHEQYQLKGFRQGREAGFKAGFEAATGQPQAKIEAAYEQGMKKVLDSR